MLRHVLVFAAVVVSVSLPGFAAGATTGQLRNHAVLGAVVRLTHALPCVLLLLSNAKKGDRCRSATPEGVFSFRKLQHPWPCAQTIESKAASTSTPHRRCVVHSTAPQGSRCLCGHGARVCACNTITHFFPPPFARSHDQKKSVTVRASARPPSKGALARVVR